MKTLLFYEIAPSSVSKMTANRAAHEALLEEFYQRGVLLMAGLYGIPPTGALAVFTTPEAANEFLSVDPFILKGVVDGHRTAPWAEKLHQASDPSPAASLL